MALRLNGKDDWLCRADFRALAATAGTRAADVDAAIDEMVARMKQAADRIALPDLPDYGPETDALAARMLEMTRTRTEAFA